KSVRSASVAPRPENQCEVPGARHGAALSPTSGPAVTSPTITALLALAMLPSAETTIGEATPDSCAPFPGSVSFRSVGFDLSVDAVSKPVRPGASRMETAENSVFPAGSPLGAADVVQIVVVRPTSGIRLAWEADPPWPSSVPPPRINSKPTSAAPSALGRARVRKQTRV